MISLDEAVRDFSQVEERVKKYSSAVIMVNGAPRYLVVDFCQNDTIIEAPEGLLASVSRFIMEDNKEAYEELAK